jgi:predicted Zn-dependent peptidase
MRLLNVILGENMSSRLFQVVREKHGLAYSVSSSFHLYDECGMLVISAGLDRKRTTRAIELIVREVNRLRTARVSDRELKMAKEYVIGQIRLGLESTTQQMMWLGDNIMSYGKFMSPEEVIEKMSAVTRNDLRDLADAVVRDSRATLAMISPDGDNAGGKQMVSILKGL